MRQDQIDDFNQRMRLYVQQLEECVDELNDHFSELKTLARNRLGSLFNESDYPSTLRGAFGISWDFPAVEPPNYLQRLNPELYQQECERVRSRFAEAARLAEEAFITELSELVSHLGERLSGQQDGKPKIFRDSAIKNLRDFFARFQSLNVGSCQELDQLVDRAHTVLSSVRPDALRRNSCLRQEVATQLSGVQSVLDGLMVDRPRRAILRSRRPRAEASE